MSQNEGQDVFDFEAEVPPVDLDDLRDSPAQSQTRDPQSASQHGSDDDHEFDDPTGISSDDISQEQYVPTTTLTASGQSYSTATNNQPPSLNNFLHKFHVHAPTTQSDFSTALMIIGGVRPYQQRYGSLEQGALAFYAPIRRRNGNDETVFQVTSNANFYVQGVYNGIGDSGNSVSRLQQAMIDAWEDVLKELDDKHTLLFQVSHMVVKAVIDLHTFGDNLRVDQIKRLEPTKQDAEMTATARIERICLVLRDTKTVCIDLLSGKDEITKFVAAPIAYEKKKYPGNSKIHDFGARNAPKSAYTTPPHGQITAADNRLPPPVRLRPQQPYRGGASTYTSHQNVSLGGLLTRSGTANRTRLQESYFDRPEVIAEHEMRMEAQRKRKASEAFGAEAEAEDA